MKPSVLHALSLLAVLAAGCSSSSSSDTETHADAAEDAKSQATHDAGASHDARTVCDPAPTLPDAGSKDAAGDAVAEDAKHEAGDAGHSKDAGGDAGPVHCEHDTECPTGDVCDTKSSGTCVTNAGAMVCSGGGEDGGGAPGTCSVNADDFCCAATTGCIAQPATSTVGGGTCCPGSAGDTYCQGKLVDDLATCGVGHVCTTCLDTCINASPAAYQKFLGYQVADCGCVADGACYDACHTSTTAAAGSACGTCLAAQTSDGLGSSCTLAAAADCSNDTECTVYQTCAGMCSM